MRNKAKNKDLYVTEISFEADETELRKLFSVCGSVQSVRLLTDQRSGKFSGRAFVRMANAEQAREAANMLDGALLIDRCVKVRAAREKSPQSLSEETNRPVRPSRRPPRRRKKS